VGDSFSRKLQNKHSLPNLHGDTMGTVNADGSLIGLHMTGPFGEVLPTQPQVNGTTTSTPWNTLDRGSFGYVGQHQKLTESALTIQPIQMGARLYIPALGRFLQVDPVQGGTDNNYAYPTDPVNDFDLDGNWSWKGIANVASWASMVPGPIGMVASGVAAASYAMAGDRKAAALALVSFVPGGKIISTIASRSKIGTKILTGVMKTQAKAPLIGTKGRLFGTKALGSRSGWLNKQNPIMKLGWSRDQGKTAFRIGFGQKSYYNIKRAKTIKVSRWHVTTGWFK
jgi:RHS repeat-associated protein